MLKLKGCLSPPPVLLCGLKEGKIVLFLNFVCHIRMCSLYYVRKNYRDDPYNSIRVTWVIQDRISDAWVYDYIQTDNGELEPLVASLYPLPHFSECSPWDLVLSDYVLPEKVIAPVLPSKLLHQPLKAKNIIVHLQRYTFIKSN